MVPAYIVVGVAGSTARIGTTRYVSPVLDAAQVPPESVDLKIPPPPVPAQSVAGVVGSMARARTSRIGSAALGEGEEVSGGGVLLKKKKTTPAERGGGGGGEMARG